MKTLNGFFVPATCAEKDAINALKLAISDHCRWMYGSFFACGKMYATGVNGSDVSDTRTTLAEVEQDENGRDANGIDIEAALTALDYIKAV